MVYSPDAPAAAKRIVIRKSATMPHAPGAPAAPTREEQWLALIYENVAELTRIAKFFQLITVTSILLALLAVILTELTRIWR
jgi:hypothetical protein